MIAEILLANKRGDNMADRYNLTYSGEQVNTAIGRGLTSLQPTTQTLSDIQKQIARTNIGAMGALNVYNPNLLINGDFAINQRGAASYTGANTYTVDRWQHGTSFLTATVLSKGIRLTASTSGTTGVNYFLFNQTIEDYKKYAGKTVTATIAYENNTFTNGKINLRCDDTTSNYSTATMSTSGIITFTLTLPSSITSSLKLIITGNHANGTEETIDVLYAKLEVGNIATPFVPPIIAEELPKCKRYYQKIISTGGSANTLGYGVLRTSTASIFNIPLSATLRTTPTIANNGLRVFNFVTGTEFTPNGTVTIGSINNNSAFVYVTHSESMGTAGAFVQTYGATGTDFISLDAEIY